MTLRPETNETKDGEAPDTLQNPVTTTTVPVRSLINSGFFSESKNPKPIVAAEINEPNAPAPTSFNS